MSGCSRPWPCRAVKSTPPRPRASTIERVPSSLRWAEFHMWLLSSSIAFRDRIAKVRV
jgi:hypothetical protein